MDEPMRGRVLTCLHIEIERTPGYGHCIVRCASCHKPGIRTWNRHREPVVTWSERVASCFVCGDEHTDERHRLLILNGVEAWRAGRGLSFPCGCSYTPGIDLPTTECATHAADSTLAHREVAGRSASRSTGGGDVSGSRQGGYPAGSKRPGEMSPLPPSVGGAGTDNINYRRRSRSRHE